MQRVEQHAAQIRCGPTERRSQVGTPYVADEQSVSGQNGMRPRIADIQIKDKDGDRFRGVARRFQPFQPYAAKFKHRTVAEGRKYIGCFSLCPQINRRTRTVAQFQVAGDEVGVEMGQEYVPDFQRVFGSECDVLVDIALRINDRGDARLRVANQVRRVRQTWQIELLENHATPLSDCRWRLLWLRNDSQIW